MRFILVDYVNRLENSIKVVLKAPVICEKSKVVEALPSDIKIIGVDIFDLTHTFIGLVDSLADAKHKYPEYFL